MDFKNKLLIAFLFVGLNTFAQNRLEFNRIVSLSGSLAGGQIMQLDTVPLGKAYKITAYHDSDHYIGFTINNFMWPNNTNINNHPSNSFPIWLKEGDILGVQDTYSSGGGGTYHISAIEFNIITD